MQNSFIEMLEENLERIDWYFSVTNSQNSWDDIDFNYTSPAGEDFWFSVCCETPYELYKEVEEYANDFDAEEHASMWIEAKARGKKGIPSLRGLIDDADEIKKDLIKLSQQVKETVKEWSTK